MNNCLILDKDVKKVYYLLYLFYDNISYTVRPYPISIAVFWHFRLQDRMRDETKLNQELLRSSFPKITMKTDVDDILYKHQTEIVVGLPPT